MNTIKDFIMKHFGTMIIAAIFFMLYLKGCFNNGAMKGIINNGPDASTEKTTQVVQPPVQVPVYIPIQTGSTQPITIPQQYNPSQDLQTLLTQYKDVLSKFLALNSYKDSVVLKDTAGNRVGVVNLDDGISENQFKYRKPSYQLSFPNTIRTNPAIKHNEVYIGMETEHTVNNLVKSASLGAMLKNKKDDVFGATYGHDFQTSGSIIGLKYYKKLSFRKKS